MKLRCLSTWQRDIVSGIHRSRTKQRTWRHSFGSQQRSICSAKVLSLHSVTKVTRGWMALLQYCKPIYVHRQMLTTSKAPTCWSRAVGLDVGDPFVCRCRLAVCGTVGLVGEAYQSGVSTCSKMDPNIAERCRAASERAIWPSHSRADRMSATALEVSGLAIMSIPDNTSVAAVNRGFRCVLRGLWWIPTVWAWPSRLQSISVIIYWSTGQESTVGLGVAD